MVCKDELLLIEIQKHSHLYDLNDKRHKNKFEREKAWNTIGKTLAVNVQECKERFRQLRDPYRKEKARGGGSDANKRQWRLFNPMRFLDNYGRPKTTWTEAATPIPDDLSETPPVESSCLSQFDGRRLKNMSNEQMEENILTSIKSEVESLDATLPQIQSVFSCCLPSPQNEASKRRNDTDMPPEKRKNCQDMDKTGYFLEYIGQECKERFHQLRARYRKENARSSDANKRQFRLFNSVRVLDNYVRPKTTWTEAATAIPDDLSETSRVESSSLSPLDERCLKNTTQETEENTLTSIKSEVESLDSTLPQIQSVFSCCLPSPQNEASKRQNDTDMPPEKRKNCQDMDQTGHFLEYIGYHLREMSKETQDLACKEILNLVLNLKNH
ncbi:hypothetical protein CDAR_530951 [Caerostris darwini]|uniref:MADF domain-containing protein n=1 Tax=Caerostris darwini TaxID=1538125 RepID=A0AAV4VTH8_9ARAC|nr:hypothetical protein CDAR_530951 [Caerostris darwini]